MSECPLAGTPDNDDMISWSETISFELNNYTDVFTAKYTIVEKVVFEIKSSLKKKEKKRALHM